MEKLSYPSNSQPQLLSTSSPSRGNFRNPLQKLLLSILPTDIFDTYIYINYMFLVYLYGVPLLWMFLNSSQTFHSTSISTSEFDWALAKHTGLQDHRSGCPYLLRSDIPLYGVTGSDATFTGDEPPRDMQDVCFHSSYKYTYIYMSIRQN